MHKLYKRIIKECTDFNEYELIENFQDSKGNLVNYIGLDYMKIRTVSNFNNLWEPGHPNIMRFDEPPYELREQGYVVSGTLGEMYVNHDSHIFFKNQQDLIYYLNSL